MDNSLLYKIINEVGMIPSGFFAAMIGSVASVLYLIKDKDSSNTFLRIVAVLFGGIALGGYSHAYFHASFDKTPQWDTLSNLLGFLISVISIHIFELLKSHNTKDVLLKLLTVIVTKYTKK